MTVKNLFVEEYVQKQFTLPEQALDFLLTRSKAFLGSPTNVGEVSLQKRAHLAENGQHPYAVIVTCSDSRVPPEHIFHAGIGELFVIRTAGNVIGEYELGSIEYGAEHLGAKVVMVLGHTQCGAVEAALKGGARGYIKKITDEILRHIPQGCDCREGEIANVKRGVELIMQSENMQELVKQKKTIVVGALYNVATGKVTILNEG